MTSNYAHARVFPLVLTVLLLLPLFAAAQKPASSKENIAVAVYQPKHLYWQPQIAYASVSLRVVGPGGFVHDQDFGTGIPAFILPAAPGVADGQYFYEIVFGRIPDAGLRAAIASGVSRDDGSATDPGLRASIAALRDTYSGTFLVAGGQIVSPDLKEPAPQPGIKSAKGVGGTTIGGPRDVVTADDAIIQGSLCVGLDCVNNESFGFDTIRLKENNTRIKFDDTSTSAGFPANDWQLTANDSNSGGANKFSIDDVTNSKTPFTITGNAPSNSIFVSSNGKVGFRTSAPVLDLHASTGDTPAIRLEQGSSGGFTAQTWDIGANEANFFVRDATGGSRLPFRVRPGAPTSSIDINASGNVGIGTASPTGKLHIGGTATADVFAGMGVDLVAGPAFNFGYGGGSFGQSAGFLNVRPDASAVAPNPSLRFMTANVERMIVTNLGRVGIGTTAPDQMLSVNGDASKVGGGSWLAFSDERLKNFKGAFGTGLKAVMQLQPIRYEYKQDNALGLTSEGEHIGFGAEALRKIIPEAVTRNANGFLMVNNDPILWTMLNAIKEQSKEIANLRGQVKRLQEAVRKRQP